MMRDLIVNELTARARWEELRIPFRRAYLKVGATELSKRTGIDRSTIYRMLRPDHTPTHESAEAFLQFHNDSQQAIK